MPEVTKSWALPAFVEGGDSAVSGAGQGAGALDDLVQNGVEVEARADAQDGRAQPGDTVSQRLVLSPQLVGTIQSAAPLGNSQEDWNISQKRRLSVPVYHTDITPIVYRQLREPLGSGRVLAACDSGTRLCTSLQPPTSRSVTARPMEAEVAERWESYLQVQSITRRLGPYRVGPSVKTKVMKVASELGGFIVQAPSCLLWAVVTCTDPSLGLWRRFVADGAHVYRPDSTPGRKPPSVSLWIDSRAGTDGRRSPPRR